MFSYSLFDNGTEIEGVRADVYFTEAEAAQAAMQQLDDYCPRLSEMRRFYRFETYEHVED